MSRAGGRRDQGLAEITICARRLAAQGADVAVESSAAYAQFVADQAKRWKQIVQVAGVPQE